VWGFSRSVSSCSCPDLVRYRRNARSFKEVPRPTALEHPRCTPALILVGRDLSTHGTWRALVEHEGNSQGMADLLGRFGPNAQVATATAPETPSHAPPNSSTRPCRRRYTCSCASTASPCAVSQGLDGLLHSTRTSTRVHGPQSRTMPASLFAPSPVQDETRPSSLS
jgi:hypothetical protein